MSELSPTMVDLHSQQWKQGYDSFFNAVARVMNPYNHGSKHRKLWYQGWDHAQAKARTS